MVGTQWRRIFSEAKNGKKKNIKSVRTGFNSALAIIKVLLEKKATQPSLLRYIAPFDPKKFQAKDWKINALELLIKGVDELKNTMIEEELMNNKEKLNKSKVFSNVAKLNQKLGIKKTN